MHPVEYSIDWLSVSGGVDLFQKTLDAGVHFRLGEARKPLAHFDTAHDLLPAGTLQESTSDQQGCLISLSGEDMTAIRHNGMVDPVLIKRMATVGKVTRLDYAVDIRTGDSPKDLESHIKSGDYETVFKVAPSRFESFNDTGGYTLYFGSPKSHRRLRIYDKAAQLKLLNEAWLRVELVTRKNRAQALASDMVKGVLWLVGHQAIVDTISFPKCKWWNDIFYQTEAVLSTVPKKPDRYQKWLGGQVNDSIRRNLEKPEHAQFISDWLDNLTTFRDQLVSKSDGLTLHP